METGKFLFPKQCANLGICSLEAVSIRMAAVCTLCGDESAHAIVLFLTLLTIGGKEHHSGAQTFENAPIVNGPALGPT